MWSIIVNGTLVLAMLVIFCFTLEDLNSILASPTGSPLVQVFFNTTNSYAGSSAMTAVVIITIIVSEISIVATCSRQLWAFARDEGLPFSSILAHVCSFLHYLPQNQLARQVYRGWDIPLNTICLSFNVTAILSLLNLGSTVALQAVFSLCGSLLLTSYIISVSTVLLRRFTSSACHLTAGHSGAGAQQLVSWPSASSALFKSPHSFPLPQ